MMTTTIPTKIRKAAILLRSLDSETATRLLAQLAPDEVQAVREAMHDVGDFDDDEQADIAAELRRAGSAAAENRDSGVEIDPSLFRQETSSFTAAGDSRPAQTVADSRFAFLDQATPQDLAPMLAGEHPQTAAVVLSLLEAGRAAKVLEAFPPGRRTEVLERLADLGDTDPETLDVIERELATWVSRQPRHAGQLENRGDHAARVMAAADPTVRAEWVAHLQSRKHPLAERLGASLPASDVESRPEPHEPDVEPPQPPPEESPPAVPCTPSPRITPPPVDAPRPVVSMNQLVNLDSSTLTRIFRQVNPQILQLALVGAEERLVERLAGQLPRAAARQFRQSLHRLGPTRLSDVATAQQLVCTTAARILADRRPASAS